ncbi:MAG: hypothetical protein RIC95_07890 [Vicingaceae bacterium]
MKKSDFNQLVKEPELAQADTVVGLQEVLREFPYFTSAQLLLTKAFHEAENLNFEKQLRKTAAYAADRKRLHQLLFHEQKVAENQNDLVDSLGIPNQEETDRITPQTPLPGKKGIEETTSLESETKEQIEAPEIPPTIETSEEGKEEKTEESTSDRKDNLLEQQILTEAISSSILMEVDEIDETELGQEKADFEENEAAKKESPRDSFNETEKHSFSDWLGHFSDTQEKSKPLWDSASSEAKSGLKAFQQREERPKQEFYSPSKMAKLSVQEDNDLVTETLAKIYLQQENFEKALQAYETLQLKYPEKKIYFAGQIEKIKDQLNS